MPEIVFKCIFHADYLPFMLHQVLGGPCRFTLNTVSPRISNQGMSDCRRKKLQGSPFRFPRRLESSRYMGIKNVKSGHVSQKIGCAFRIRYFFAFVWLQTTRGLKRTIRSSTCIMYYFATQTRINYLPVIFNVFLHTPWPCLNFMEWPSFK